MKRRMVVLSLVLAAAVAAAVSSEARAGDQVPFKGCLEGTVTRSLPPPPIDVDIEAVGNATHLGLFTVDIPHLVVPPHADGFYYFEAANGDSLTAEFEGVSAPYEPGVLYIVEVATITGGTGRFEGASGGFVAERYYYIAAGVTVGTFQGTVSTPGAGAP